MFTKKLIANTFFVSALVYVVGVALVGIGGNFPVNDDWIFVRQVEYFLNGGVKLSALVDPSFVFQGFLGVLWSKIFGFSFVSLRFLTIVITLFLGLGVYRLLQHFKTTAKWQVIILLLLFFNPVVFSSSFTFMTENYFLAFFVWSLYFYVRHLKKLSLKTVLLGSLFCGLSILIRQVGLVTYIAFLMTVLFSKKFNLKRFLVGVLSILAFGLIAFYWPRFGDKSPIIELAYLSSRLKTIIGVLPYLSYFLLPLLLTQFTKLSRNVKLLILLVALIIVKFVYTYDLFPLGSVFYIEELHAKTGFRSNLSLFDNVGFKIILSYLMSVGIGTLIYELIHTKFSWLLTFTFLGMFATLLVSTDLYDRYLLPSFIPLLLLFLPRLPKVTRITLVLTVAFLLVSVFLTYDYFIIRQLKWDQATHLQEATGLKTGIFLDGTYTKFTRAKDKVDYTGLIKTMPNGLIYTCFVQDYTLDTASPVLSFITTVEELAERRLDNPKIHNRKKLEGIPRIKKHLDDLLYNKEYFSPLYNLIGKKAFVGSFCVYD